MWPRRCGQHGWRRGPQNWGVYFSPSNITELPKNGSHHPFSPCSSSDPPHCYIVTTLRWEGSLWNCYAPAAFWPLFHRRNWPADSFCRVCLRVPSGGTPGCPAPLSHGQGAVHGSPQPPAPPPLLLCTLGPHSETPPGSWL